MVGTRLRIVFSSSCGMVDPLRVTTQLDKRGRLSYLSNRLIRVAEIPAYIAIRVVPTRNRFLVHVALQPRALQ